MADEERTLRNDNHEVFGTFNEVEKQHRSNLLALLQECFNDADLLSAAAVTEVLLGMQDPQALKRNLEGKRQRVVHKQFTNVISAAFEVLRRQPFTTNQVQRYMRRLQQCAPTTESLELLALENSIWLIELGEWQLALDALQLVTSERKSKPATQHFQRTAYSALIKHRQWTELMQENRSQDQAKAGGMPAAATVRTAPMPLQTDAFIYSSHDHTRAQGQRRVVEVRRESEKLLKEALVLRPDATFLSWLLVQMHMTAGHFDAAAAVGMRAAASAPDDASAHALAALTASISVVHEDAADVSLDRAHDIVSSMLGVLRADGTCRAAMEGLLELSDHCEGCRASATLGCLLFLDDAAAAGTPWELTAHAWAGLACHLSAAATSACAAINQGVLCAPRDGVVTLLNSQHVFSHWGQSMHQPHVETHAELGAGLEQAGCLGALGCGLRSTSAALNGHPKRSVLPHAAAHKLSACATRVCGPQAVVCALPGSNHEDPAHPPQAYIGAATCAGAALPPLQAGGAHCTAGQAGTAAGGSMPATAMDPAAAPMILWAGLQAELHDRGYWWLITHFPAVSPAASGGLPRLLLPGQHPQDVAPSKAGVAAATAATTALAGSTSSGASYGAAVQRVADVAVVAAFMLGPTHALVQQAEQALVKGRKRVQEDLATLEQGHPQQEHKCRRADAMHCDDDEHNMLDGSGAAPGETAPANSAQDVGFAALHLLQDASAYVKEAVAASAQLVTWTRGRVLQQGTGTAVGAEGEGAQRTLPGVRQEHSALTPLPEEWWRSFPMRRTSTQR